MIACKTTVKTIDLLGDAGITHINRLLDGLSGYPQIQLTQDQRCHLDEVLDSAMAPGFGFDGLDQAVEPFQYAFGDLAFEPV